MIDSYKRNAVFSSLEQYCPLSKKDGYIEVTEWNNGEGYDFFVNNGTSEQRFSLTVGELRLLQVLTNYQGPK